MTVRAAFVAACLPVMLLAAPAAADAPAPAAESQPAASPPENPWDKTLLGDFGQLRSKLKPLGLSLNLTETSEVLGNVTGGIRQGAIYEGLTDANLTFDLRTKFEWPGVIYARAFQIHGRGLSADNLGNLITASSIEATPTTRLFELWYEHYATDWLRVKIGQQAADQEFLVSTTAKLFVNSTFGFPTLPATDLPSGGPAYPLGTPAVRLQVNPSDEIALLAGVFNGDPAGPGPGLAQVRDAAGTAFRTSDGALALFEAQYNPGHSPQNGTYKIGAWFNSERFPDQRRDNTGMSLADPLSTGVPRLLGNDYSLYGIVDQPIGQSGLTGFFRVMGAPGDRNLIDFYFDAGLVYAKPFDRDGDQVGIAFGYARIADSARQLDRDTGFFSGQPYPVRSAEAILEVSYQYAVSGLPWLQLQPDFQYIFSPGGGIPNPNAPSRTIGSAAIFGLRTAITF